MSPAAAPPLEPLAEIILACLHREYPNKLAHLILHEGDIGPPRELTPIFFGCFDWHSAVHSHWSLVRILRLGVEPALAAWVRGALDAGFTAERVAGELAYLAPPERAGFEVPYGMAWMLRLCGELDAFAAAGDPDAARWGEVLAPLAALARDRLAAWLPRLSHPIRTGEHNQSAFAMSLFLDWARAAGDSEAAALVTRRALDFHAGDRDGPLAYEPSAHDFLSPCLAAADLMRRVLPPPRFAGWLTGFLPALALEPVAPVDRADGKLVHLDGLNLSRAWMLRGIAAGLPAADPRRPDLLARADRHAAAGLAGVSGDHYAGAHWLPSFALLALA